MGRSARNDWPIIVGGCPRSGTSLVRRILDAHPRIDCGPEVTFFRDFYGAFQDDPYRHLRFATTARSLVPQDDERLQILGGGFLRLHEEAAKAAGKARWADKSPDNAVHLPGWTKLLGSTWFFVLVVRNPLDTIGSIASVGFPKTIPASLDGRIGVYEAHIRHALDFVLENADRAMVLPYEALIARPTETIAELMEFIGEEPHPSQVRFNEVEHVIGLEDPHVASTTAVHGESVHSWVHRLDLAEARHVWARTAALWRRIDPEERFVQPPA